MERDTSALRLPARLTLAIAAALGLAVVVNLLVVSPGDTPGRDAGLLASAFAAGGVAAVLRAAHARWRLEDVVLVAGLVPYALGWVYWAAVLQPLADPPYPSAADLLWVVLYPCAVVVLVLQAAAGVRLRSTFLLDVAIGSLGATSAVAGIFAPALAGSGQEQSVLSVNGLYLAGDATLLLLTFSVLAIHRFSVPVHLWLRAAAVVVFVITDAMFLPAVAASGVIAPEGLLNVGWLTAFGLMVASVGWQVPVSPPASRPRWSVLIVPLAGTVVALAVLVRNAGQSPLAHWVAAAAVLLAIARMGVAFLQVDALAVHRELSVTDELTGLANRRGFYRAAQRHLDDGGAATLVLLDLDHFKEVNDTLGHGAGDALLALVAQRITAVARRHADARKGDVVARLGGDEFAVLFSGVSPAEGREVTRRLTTALAATYDVEGIRVRVSAAAGMVHSPADGRDLDELLRRADVAMYASKSAGNGPAEYHPELDSRSREHLVQVEQVRAALGEGRLVLHYQPRVELRTGAVTGVEVLARLTGPGGILLLPDDFLDLLAHDGQMVELTALVLDRALAQARLWRDNGRALTVAVNVPSMAFIDGDLVGDVQRALTRHGLDGGALVLEMNRVVVPVDHRAARATLTALRELDVQVSIDHYGTGYSSLAYLRDLPLAEIKLDPSFVAAMVDQPRAAQIVDASVALAHRLGMRVVAAGVETQAAAAAARDRGCDQ
ncbi:MAG: EAL domain-containing protein, partial [Cellulomonadaceae bacterium]|nr:EAL domain-containing protein [Cellulomonadaceae bacterium]